MSSLSARTSATPLEPTVRRGRGRPPRPVVEHPAPLWKRKIDPQDFATALDAEMARHGDSIWSLHKALSVKGATIDRTTLGAWRRNAKAPENAASLEAVALIEHRYRLPPGELRRRLGAGRAIAGQTLPPGVSPAERRRLAWHLPDDFARRSAEAQQEIIDWVRSSILTGGTAYHRYHAAISKHRFAFRFDHLLAGARRSAPHPRVPPEFVPPARLEREMADLLRFKTRTLTQVGFQRSGVWGVETASQKLEHLGPSLAVCPSR